MTGEATSEEKLLKLIRQKNKSGHSRRKDQGHGDLPAGPRPAKKKAIPFLEAGSVVLLILSVACAAYLVFHYVLAGNPRETIAVTRAVDASAGGRRLAKVVLPEMKPFGFYEPRFAERDIFELPGEIPKAPEAPRRSSAPVEEDLSKKLKIVGIVLEGEDSKAIFEDLKKGQTVFLSEGEDIEGAVLETIQEDKVIFHYHDKQVEMVR